MFLYIAYTERENPKKQKNRPTVLQNFFLLRRYHYVQWNSIQNDYAKKNNTIVCFYGRYSPAQDQVLILQDRIFHQKMFWKIFFT